MRIECHVCQLQRHMCMQCSAQGPCDSLSKRKDRHGARYGKVFSPSQTDDENTTTQTHASGTVFAPEGKPSMGLAIKDKLKFANIS